MFYFHVLVSILVVLIACIDSTVITSEEDLKTIQQNLYKDNTFFDDYKKLEPAHYLRKSYDKFYSNKYSHYVDNDTIPVLIHIINIGKYGFGNSYGFYLEAMSCAEELGAHFIGVWHSEYFPSVNSSLSKLPTLKFNPKAITRQEIMNINIEERCAKDFPWEVVKNSWLKHQSNIEYTLRPILQYFINSTYLSSSEFEIIDKVLIPVNRSDVNEISLKYELSNIPKIPSDIIKYIDKNPNLKYDLASNNIERNYNNVSITTIPLIPDALIQLRCDDVIGFGIGDKYGFLNFNVYQMIIPKSVKSIYILTYQSKHRDSYHIRMCQDLVIALVLFLSIHYPPESTVIAVFRGGNPFDSLTQIALSSGIIICSTSTFCWWPALLNSQRNSRIYVPLTWLFVNTKPIYFKDNWNWISYPQVHQFGPFFEGSENKRYESIRDAILTLLISDKPR